MKWVKYPEKRTPFGVWLDDRETFQNEVADASGIFGNKKSLLSTLGRRQYVNL